MHLKVHDPACSSSLDVMPLTLAVPKNHRRRTRIKAGRDCDPTCKRDSTQWQGAVLFELNDIVTLKRRRKNDIERCYWQTCSAQLNNVASCSTWQY